MTPKGTDSGGFSAGRGTPVAFKRRFLVPGLALTALELVFVVWPAFALFDPTSDDRSIMLRVAAPVIGGALAIWYAAMAAWLSPVQRAVLLRRQAQKIPKQLAARAYRATWRVPLRALVLRSVLWTAVGAANGLILTRYGNWLGRDAGHLTALVATHAVAVNLVRALWYGHILTRVRAGVFPEVTTLREFADGYFRKVVLICIVVAGGALAAVAAFMYFFIFTEDKYLEAMLYVPSTIAVSTAILVVLARLWTRTIDQYLEAHTYDSDRDPAATGTDAQGVYRRAQELPYRLAGATVALWLLGSLFASMTARMKMDVEFDDATLLFGSTVVIAVGAALYQALWHRETMRPLLGHLSVRHRLPMRTMRAALSLRAKLLLSFGGVVVFACGLALFWGFIQYKTLVTGFTGKQADLGLAWLRSEVQAKAAADAAPPTPTMVRRVLLALDTQSPTENAVYYYQPAETSADTLALGGGPMGAPTLPWYARARISLRKDKGVIEIGSLGLSGRHGRLVIDWHGTDYDVGSIAVLFPSYSGRGPTIERPLKELLVFFLVLFGVCGGIAVLTVAEFVKPIRKLEQRADGMARGELAQPVTSGGESDEIGRLTFALEEMRRALGEKLRSTEEVNLDLERAVQRRTSDLAKKNRELAETLEKLTRAQSQLVRSEKMASIGQLVAGIAHEINNPVNAIVNTVSPLDEALADLDNLDGEDKDDVRDMIRVIKRGAQRTKDIVQALHNYSRTDDESVVDVDLNRSLDDSLELLRHILKGNITVERDYQDVGRIRGHAGQLNQVFMNLLTNAAQAVASRTDATIWVTTRPTADGVVVTVRDNGAGIPPDVLPRIFDPFFTTKEVGEGTGLGLSIVHGIVERHGGTIEVDPVDTGGTAFKVVLPRNDAPVEMTSMTQ